MLYIFKDLANMLKTCRVYNDGFIFRLHYRLTVIILISLSLLVTTRQYVGDPIQCLASNELPAEVIDTFCWIQSTYTIPQVNENKVVGVDIPYPGIGRPSEKSERKYHKYYQWVCFMLFFQAILFYIPRWLWKNWEGGKIRTLKIDLDPDVAKMQEKRRLLTEYLWANRRTHTWWAMRYVMSEMLCLANVVGQLFLVDRFFEGEFSTYGIRVIQFASSDPDERNDPMISIFPRVTMCQFHRYGPSGGLMQLNTLCVLPLNVVNEKIYIFLWFWFLFLALLTALLLAYRVLILSSLHVRILLLKAHFRNIDHNLLRHLVSRTQFGDWLLFYLLSQNLDTPLATELLADLANLAASI